MAQRPRVNTKPVQYRGAGAGRLVGGRAGRQAGRQADGRAGKQCDDHSLGCINKPASGILIFCKVPGWWERLSEAATFLDRDMRDFFYTQTFVPRSDPATTPPLVAAR